MFCYNATCSNWCALQRRTQQHARPQSVPIFLCCACMLIPSDSQLELHSAWGCQLSMFWCIICVLQQASTLTTSRTCPCQCHHGEYQVLGTEHVGQSLPYLACSVAHSAAGVPTAGMLPILALATRCCHCEHASCSDLHAPTMQVLGTSPRLISDGAGETRTVSAHHMSGDIFHVGPAQEHVVCGVQWPSGASLSYESNVGLWLCPLCIAHHQSVLHGGRSRWAAHELWCVCDTVLLVFYFADMVHEVAGERPGSRGLRGVTTARQLCAMVTDRGDCTWARWNAQLSRHHRARMEDGGRRIRGHRATAHPDVTHTGCPLAYHTSLGYTGHSPLACWCHNQAGRSWASECQYEQGAHHEHLCVVVEYCSLGQCDGPGACR